MGIKDLGSVIRNQNINCKFNIPLHDLKNTKMGIDTLNWIFTYINPVIKNIINNSPNILEAVDENELYRGLITEFMKFNLKLLKTKITPIWIWDGKAKPVKADTQNKRREQKRKMIVEKERIKNILINMNVFERNGSPLLDQYKKLCVNTVYIPRNKIEKLKEFCLNSGLPCITAENEAESLASSLALEKHIKSVWSADTDTYVLGAPLVVNKFKYIDNTLTIESVYTPNILKYLNLTYCEFRDFCILLGTDFNNRIVKMGPVSSLKLIKEHRNIENMEKALPNIDFSVLNYNVVRKELSPYKTNYKCSDFKIKINKNLFKVDEYLKELDLSITGEISFNDSLYIIKLLKNKNIKNNLYIYDYVNLNYFEEFFKTINQFENN